MYFKNKVVWITGASSGIGEALAYAFSRNGADLIISSNDEAGLQRVKKNCLVHTSICLDIPFDLEDTSAIERLVKDVIEKTGRIDILINNGGISQRAATLETPLSLDRKIMEINYFGAITLTKHVLPNMLKNGFGHIAITSSITGRFGFPLRSAYAASKHALFGFFETLSMEYRNKNIYVTIVCPGRVKTDISLHALTANGTAWGKMDKGQETGMLPEKCADKYLNAIRKKKKEVYIGGKEIFMVYLKRFLPAIFYQMVARIDPRG